MKILLFQDTTNIVAVSNIRNSEFTLRIFIFNIIFDTVGKNWQNIEEVKFRFLLKII